MNKLTKPDDLGSGDRAFLASGYVSIFCSYLVCCSIKSSVHRYSTGEYSITLANFYFANSKTYFTFVT